jgi:soluble lytic murein transglycosylase
LPPEKKDDWKNNKTIQKIIKDDPIIGKIIQAESSGNQNTPDSPKGAMGLMQLMPKTVFGRVTEDGEQLYAHGMYGKRLTPEEVYDPEKNVVFGAQYFNALRKTFGKDRDALIAYNFGVGNTKKWLKRGGNLEELPDETRNYIKKILGSK